MSKCCLCGKKLGFFTEFAVTDKLDVCKACYEGISVLWESDSENYPMIRHNFEEKYKDNVSCAEILEYYDEQQATKCKNVQEQEKNSTIGTEY